ncbi:phosphoenolpyruvate--protein phosphotransferase [Roseospira marina]|uniref:phosphoenolpyruvate--protein phosphotransferase n=1 Tax=Roseospira marina TaxID=140057 RepID=A0A5M6IDA5_9PROT|nr:phosphoenolpyruvate--protein phosphotransferase [Roseospira marina]KAA5606264.1 phosphoenolpyruvate--protein phosphotransferase [Roseospira marina]MBB4314420.1 phosphocarrier protein FPr [Roseospira marina]MBB5087580.1 phosphocarrier protein FPr [Roseospira marina]
MALLTPALVKTGATAASKAEAIRAVVALLAKAGKVDPRYADSMLGREKVANTYLGNGIAIPHGLPKDRGLIHDTAIAVLQLPDGVEWGPGDRVHLVVGIAARNDEHLGILTNLTDVLGEEADARRLATTPNAAEIVARLTGAPAPTAPPRSATLTEFADGFEITVPGVHGLHARPATALVDLAKGFPAAIRVAHGNRIADAKSLVSLLRLGAGPGARVRVTAEGPDADIALITLRNAIADGLGEDGRGEPGPRDGPPTSTGPSADYEGRTIAGVAASPGCAVGALFPFARDRIVYAPTAKDPQRELAALDQALHTAGRQLNTLYMDVWKTSGAARAGIFRAHEEFLNDPEMLDAARVLIRKGRSAPAAWEEAYEERVGFLAGLKDAVLAGRAVDLRDAGRRVLRLLADTVEDESSLPTEPCILVAEDLTPSDTARLDPTLVLGLCTAGGGPTSHTSIIARSLDIPAVVGAGNSVLDLAPGTPVLLDGGSGLLVVQPTDTDRARAQTLCQAVDTRRAAERQDCFKPALTTDGHRIEVVANISDGAEAVHAVDAGGEGVGLLRTEFLFVNRDAAPTEDEQAEAYTAMVQAMNGLPMILRTLDVGGDKAIPYLSMPAEQNPFLGERGIRFCFAHEDLFRTQLRAMFRASARGPVRIMFPMIALLEELHRARAIAEAVRLEIGAGPVEIGMMIEVPSAVVMAPEFARAVDFFSIGTNDLTQYTLAMDRMNPVLARQADGLHPAVLRLIDQTVKAADAAGIWVGACGGIAGDPRGVTILTGLGVRELSVSIPSIAAVKAQIRDQSLAANRALATRALACTDAAAVRALVS